MKDEMHAIPPSIFVVIPRQFVQAKSIENWNRLPGSSIGWMMYRCMMQKGGTILRNCISLWMGVWMVMGLLILWAELWTEGVIIQWVLYDCCCIATIPVLTWFSITSLLFSLVERVHLMEDLSVQRISLTSWKKCSSLLLTYHLDNLCQQVKLQAQFKFRVSSSFVFFSLPGPVKGNTNVVSCTQLCTVF